MFNRSREQTTLEHQIERALHQLDRCEPGTEEYLKILDAVVKLHDMKEQEKPSAINKNTMALIGANLLSIIIILKHEQIHPITSRALSLLLRVRT